MCTSCCSCKVWSMANEQTIHVRLPNVTYKALIEKWKSVGEDLPMSIVVRRLLDEALGVKHSKKLRKTDR